LKSKKREKNKKKNQMSMAIWEPVPDPEVSAWLESVKTYLPFG